MKMRTNYSKKYLVKLKNIVRNTSSIEIGIIVTVILFCILAFLLVFFLIPGTENTSLADLLMKLLDVERRRGALISLAYTIGFCVAVWGLLHGIKRTKVMIGQSNLSRNTRSDTRFRDGLLLIGNESPQIRIGGFKVLMALAHEDVQKLEDVQDILCGYIYERASGIEYMKAYRTEPSPDIQKLLTLMFLPAAEGAANVVSRGREKLWDRTRKICIKGTPQRKVYLAGINMAGADLHDILFERVLFGEANLAGANFRRASIKHVQFGLEILRDQDLKSTDLDIRLVNSHAKPLLVGANFQNSEIEHTDFNLANLHKADFRRASI